MVEPMSADEPRQLLTELCDLVAERVPAESNSAASFHARDEAAQKLFDATQRELTRALRGGARRGRGRVCRDSPPGPGEVRSRAQCHRGPIRNGPRGRAGPLRDGREHGRTRAAGRPVGGHHDRRGGQGGLRPGVARHPEGIGHPLAGVAGDRVAGGGVAAAARAVGAVSRAGLHRRALGASPRPAVHQGPRSCPRAVPRAGGPESAPILQRHVADVDHVPVAVGPVHVSGRLPAPLGVAMGARQRRRRLRRFPLPVLLAARHRPAAFHQSLSAAAADSPGGGGGPAGRARSGQERLPAALRRHRRAARRRDQEGRRALRRRADRHHARQATGTPPGRRNVPAAAGRHDRPARPGAGRGGGQVSPPHRRLGKPLRRRLAVAPPPAR